VHIHFVRCPFLHSRLLFSLSRRRRKWVMEKRGKGTSTKALFLFVCLTINSVSFIISKIKRVSQEFSHFFLSAYTWLWDIVMQSKTFRLFFLRIFIKIYTIFQMQILLKKFNVFLSELSINSKNKIFDINSWYTDHFPVLNYIRRIVRMKLIFIIIFLCNKILDDSYIYTFESVI